MAGSTQQAHQQRCERVAPRQDISRHQLKKNAKTQMHLRQPLWGLTKNISHPKYPQPAAAGTGLEPASPLGPRRSRGPGSPRSRGGAGGVCTEPTAWSPAALAGTRRERAGGGATTDPAAGTASAGVRAGEFRNAGSASTMP